jgi:integrase
MARRRFQNGSLRLVKTSWEARWRDYQQDGSWHYRSKVIGTLSDFPTKKLATREFKVRILDRINDRNYRSPATYTFAEFVIKWEASVMSQFKPSSQQSIRSEVKRLTAYFGAKKLTDIMPEDVQRFVSTAGLSPKYTKNLIADFRMIWNTARAWQYVSHDPLFGIRLPKVNRSKAPAYTLDETKLILADSVEPFFTMYWIAAETGPRGGEFVALKAGNIDFDAPRLSITESIWNGKLQSPKTGNAVRTFAISRTLAEHLRIKCKGKAADDLLFVKEDGSFYRQDSVQKYNLKPLLKRLKICCDITMVDGKEVVTVKPDYGLHAFRHANVTFMDQLHAPVAVRVNRVGHGDFGTTKGYTHLVSADDQRIAEGINAMILHGILHPSDAA